MHDIYIAIIVAPNGEEFAAEEAPRFATLEEARDAALHCALILDASGDSRSEVIVRNLATGEVESRYVSEAGLVRALAGR